MTIYSDSKTLTSEKIEKNYIFNEKSNNKII